MSIKTDICVIGAGSGGLSVASGAAQMGADVVLIEGGKMGGDCLNYGCVPSKSLLAAAKAAQAQRRGGPGVAGHEPTIDFAKAQHHVTSVIETIAPHDSQERFERLGCRVIRGFAKFVAHDTVEVAGERITARRFVVATGSRPVVPPIPGLSAVPFLTNETIFDLTDAPDHLLIIGGGPIGLELAQAHRRLGSRVTVIEGSKALGHEDEDAAKLVIERLREEGVEIIEGAEVTSVSGVGGGVTLHTSMGEYNGTHLLLAVGRQVNIDGLDLHRGQIESTKAGVTVDDSLRSTSNRRVFAVGDVAGGMQFTHLAGYHGGLVVRKAVLGLPIKARTDHIPRVTYCDPELAQIGLTEAEAKEKHGSRLTVIKQPFSTNDRALAEGASEGFLKLMVVGGKPVGVTIVGAGAGNHLDLWALAFAQKMKLSDISNVVLPYPTRGEISKAAIGAFFSPKLFDNPWVKRATGVVQKVLR